MQFLLKVALRINGRTAEMARLCGYLHLALRLAGGVIAGCKDLSPADYLRRLQNAQTHLALVDASLSLSYDLLPDTPRLLRHALAIFPATFDRSAATVVWQRHEESTQDAPDHSFAGQFATFLDVQGLDEILTAIRGMWASTRAVETETYLQQVPLEKADLKMGVIIQHSGVFLGARGAEG